MPRSARFSKRLVRIVVQLVPVLRVDAVDEQVRVEGRHRDEGEHIAGFRLDRDQRASPVAKGLLDHALQFDVDRQGQVVAGQRRRALQRAHRTAAGRDFDFLVAGRAVQVALVALLDAKLADVIGAGVGGRVTQLLDPLEVALRNAADVPEHVRAHLPQRIIAEQPGAQFDAGEAVALRGEARHFLVRQARADRHRVEALGVLHQLLETPPVTRLDLDHLRQLVDRLLDVLHL